MAPEKKVSLSSTVAVSTAFRAGRARSVNCLRMDPCSLSHSEPRCCVLLPRIITDANGAEFSDPTFDEPLVTERIRRAAILFKLSSLRNRQFVI
jgi:hypothetical protein